MYPREDWRPVAGFEGLYEISSLGRVKSLPRTYRSRSRAGRAFNVPVPERILTPVLRAGYETYSLNRQGEAEVRSAHAMVAEAFIGPRPPGMLVLHNDGDQRHNAWTNLRYGTHVDNAGDASAHGTLAIGERAGNAKLTERQASAVKALRAPRSPVAAALAEIFGLRHSYIYHLWSGRSWAHVPPMSVDDALSVVTEAAFKAGADGAAVVRRFARPLPPLAQEP